MFIDLKLKNLDEEYKNIVKDSLKVVTVLLVINMFMFVANPREHVLLGSNYLEFVVYVLLGILSYSLVVSKIIKFD
jgi:hypothetical protein|tara:strand:- start:2733 stop:2960 length:228 start_codon:yes stop_codon:yes gene_type:complete